MTISFYNEDGRITGELSGDAVIYVRNGTEPDFPSITTAGLPPFSTAKRLWVEGGWWNQPVYVVNGEVTNRPVNPLIVSGNDLSELIYPCTIAINGTEYHCDSSTATLELFHPGSYKVKVSVWPYLDREFTIENPA